MKLTILCLIIALLIAPAAFAGGEEGGISEVEPTDVDPTDLEAEQNRPGDEATERDIIIAHLSHYHQVPDRETLERSSDQARQIVFEIARDEDEFLFHRQRALRALVNWPDDEVYNYLVGLLQDEEIEDGMRHHLMPVLAEAFGERVLDELLPFLFESSDPQIRITAASAIASIPGEPARAQLERALSDEQNPVVHSRIENFATRLR